MKKLTKLLAALALFTSAQFSSLSAEELSGKFGIVNMVRCLQESTLGKKEGNEIKKIEADMRGKLQKLEASLKELAAKFDPEYLDGLSEKEEQELKAQFQKETQAFRQQESTYYQILKQAQMNLQQKLINSIGLASQEVAKETGIDYIMNNEVLVSYNMQLDVTDAIIKKMDAMLAAVETEEADSE